MTLSAYKNSQELKDKLIEQMTAHKLADELVRGQYWEDGKGCAVGCMTHLDGDEEPHEQYPEMFGLPEWLAYLEDVIFEGLPNERAKEFPIQLLESIKPGADLSPVKDEFILWILKNELHYDREAFPDVAEAVDAVINLYEEDVDRDDERWSAAWSAADSAADSAAESARLAARSAAWSAAESAEWLAARAAAESVRFTARSAESAKSAWLAAYERMADQLLLLLSKCE